MTQPFPGRIQAYSDRSGPANEDGFILLSVSHLQGLEITLNIADSSMALATKPLINEFINLRKKSLWRILVLRWHRCVVFCTIMMLMISIPLLVYQMIVAFKDPPPSLLFHVAAIMFGALTEILLTK
ncbi:hypothetical protein JD844_017642 [Phrynosoma platyrhinos]|uniref:Uncharacterized protein n=1 Tax=Phrynosoma platyrhinos TaxID=52577 RepID=A0ABQ7SM62_PHRPL|nr:hypothetical protein JD844_017642 [Phrynosoma platyrhinos]